MWRSALWLVVAISLPPRSAWGIVVSWNSCPQIQMSEVTEYDCDLDQVPWLLSPLAHVPGGANTLNIFHNPYPPLGCIFHSFYCRKDSIILGDLHYQTRTPGTWVCPGFSILLAKGSLMLQLRTNPGSKECRTVERWLSLDLLVYRQNEYIFMYGCHQASDNLPVSIGAWILVDANATVAKRNRVMEIARKLALKIPGFRDDWWIFPRDNERCFGNWSCDYLAHCKTNRQESPSIEIDYESTQTVYFIVGPLLFVIVIIVLRTVYKYVHSNKIGPTQPPAQGEQNE